MKNLKKPDISQYEAGKKQVENRVYGVPKKRLLRHHKRDWLRIGYELAKPLFRNLKSHHYHGLATSWQRAGVLT